MNAPRKVLIAAILVVFATAFSTASNIYIAQNAAGGNTGADCANAHAAAWFNSSSNWGSAASQIGPGTTVHLCGTFNAPAGANGYLTFQGSDQTEVQSPCFLRAGQFSQRPTGPVQPLLPTGITGSSSTEEPTARFKPANGSSPTYANQMAAVWAC